VTLSTMRRARPLAGTALAAVLACSACTVDNSNSNNGGSSGAPQKLTVAASDDACKVSSDHAPAGTLTFEVTNKGSKVTEFYMLAESGQHVVGEVENIGPGLTRSLVVQASAGRYVTACKPGMTGKGIRHSFTVTGG
jgi:iron uptake system component EfeO